MTINESAWFKSSHSDTEGAECVEVAFPWLKSSHSGGAGGECVEIAASPHAVHIRDSKRTNGPQLAVPTTAWADFINHCR
ncbi:DUF397 domain-containing protein [Streptomyces blastmyceticus]|uniref:DUF397 domain-containing protein n=1 Tax=Streptomyces blastmyceticus TaxID=68180 RepID=A0ABP3H2D6_9ACTN